MGAPEEPDDTPEVRTRHREQLVGLLQELRRDFAAALASKR